MLSAASRSSRKLFIDAVVKSPRGYAVKSASALSPHYSTAGHFDWTQSRPKAKHARRSEPAYQVKPPQGLPPSFNKDVAIRNAIRGQAESLNDRLWSYLEQNNTQEIIELYDQYMEARNAHNAALRQPTPSDSESSLVFAVEDEPAPIPRDDIDHVRVVLTAVAAHAMQDSLEGAIKAFNTANIPWPESIASQFIRRFQSDIPLHDKLATYFRDVKIGNWLLNPAGLSKHIKALAKTRSLPAIWELYSAMLQGITRPKPFISPSDTSPQVTFPIPIAPSEIVWGSFLVAFLRCDRSDLSEQLWRTLHELNVPSGTSLWTTYLDGYDHLRVAAPALQLWKQMVAKGAKPDALTYRAIISVCLRDSQQAIGLNKFAEFRRQEMTSSWSKTHRLSVYNTVIDGLLLNQSAPKALQLMDEMKKSGPTPDVVTYNILLGNHHRRSDFAAIGRTITEMDARKVQGNGWTFSILLTALLKAGKKDAADIVFECMREQGVQANVAIYTTLIDNQLQTRTESSLLAVLSLLDKMVAERIVMPNDVTYTSILTNLHRGNWLAPEQIAAYQQAILKRMKAQRVQLNLPGYHTILKACLEATYEGHIKHAMAFYNEIKQRGIPLVQTTWYILISGLVQKEEWVLARWVVEEMRLAQITPSASLSRVISTVLRHTG